MVLMKTTIGLDVGTTSLKALLVEESGQVRASSSRDYPLYQPRDGWSEQNPEDWWKAAREVGQELMTHLSSEDELSGIGLSGQMHGSIFLDARSQILYPAILWNDQRTHAEAEDIIELTGGRVTEWTLNPPRTAFTASKILWFQRHKPDLYEKIAHILLPKDTLRYWLTGEFATDVTDASGMHLLDVRTRDWSQPMLDALSIERGWLGRLVESVEESGRVTPKAAEMTGLPAGTPVVGGGADQAAASIGNGITRTGVCSITIGTSGVVYVQLDGVTVDPTGGFHTFCHAVPGANMMMAGVLSAGGSLRWYRDNVATEEIQAAKKAGRDPYDLICEQAASVPIGAEGLIFLPYLTGERAPHNDPLARGSWLGITARHTRAHMARAVLEGISFALRDLVEQLRNLGITINELRVAGGGARNDIWMQMLADMLGQPPHRTQVPDASAYGAALLAMASALDTPIAEIAGECVRPSATFTPNTALQQQYDDYYALYRQFYPAARATMHALSRLSQKRDPHEVIP